jgi:hypothetical protein
MNAVMSLHHKAIWIFMRKDRTREEVGNVRNWRMTREEVTRNIQSDKTNRRNMRYVNRE